MLLYPWNNEVMVNLVDVEEWQWDAVMNVNVKGPFFPAREIEKFRSTLFDGASRVILL